MHNLKFFVLPAVGLTLWVAIAASTLSQLELMARATQPAVRAPAPEVPVEKEAPVLTAAR
jgi:hypothetical protein